MQHLHGCRKVGCEAIGNHYITKDTGWYRLWRQIIIIINFYYRTKTKNSNSSKRVSRDDRNVLAQDSYSKNG